MAGLKILIFCAFLSIFSLSSANPIRMASEFYKQAGNNEDDIWRPHTPQLNFNPLAPHVSLQSEFVNFSSGDGRPEKFLHSHDQGDTLPGG